MRSIILVAFALLLGGCDPAAQPDSIFEDYRLARTLDLRVQLTPIHPAPAFPQPRDRVGDIEAINLSLLDFLRLYGCDLQFVVGERNSILGRVAHPLTRLDHERRFIMAAEACAASLQHESLAEKLLGAAARCRWAWIVISSASACATQLS